MKNIGEKRGHLNYIFTLRNEAKRALDERDEFKFESKIRDIKQEAEIVLKKIEVEGGEG